MEDFQPVETFIISDLDTLRVAAEPLRMQILEVLIQQPLSVRQVAEKLGQSASKLYYHVNLLEKHGLIRLVETRQVANLVEKFYRAAAAGFEVDPGLLSFTIDQGKATYQDILAGTLDTTREDILRSFQARLFDRERGAPPQPRRALINRQVSRLTEERAGEFLERLEALVKEFEAAEKESTGEHAESDLQTYALAIAYYPSFYYPEEDRPA